MTHKTDCAVYVITAFNKNTGLLEGYYSHHTTFFDITPTIWYAKFLMTLESAIKYRSLLLQGMPENTKGEPLEWRIQEVSMNTPTDVE